MKVAALTMVALVTACAADTARAGGLTTYYDDPEVIAPAPTWNGFYAGLTASRGSKGEEGLRCFKLGQPKDCDDPIFEYYPEYKEVESFSTKESSTSAGAFIGYRKDLGQLVLGGELSYSKALSTAEAQVGLDLGKILPYVSAGYGEGDNFSGAVYGVGADLLLGDKLLVGVKSTNAEGQGSVVSLRVGLRF